MKIFITGGAGFIGSSLIRFLLTKTQNSVINFDALTYAGNTESIPENLLSEKYNFINASICDYKDIEHALHTFEPDVVMHLAAESHVDRSIDKPNEFIYTNILGTFNLLEASRNYYEKLPHKRKDIFRFHHISTDEVFGDLTGTKDLFTEKTPYSPSSPYSASKASSDHLVRAWHRTYDLPTIISNCSNNYGPYHFPEKLIPHVILNAIRGNPLPVYGDGSQIRDWLFVEDHAKALYTVITKGEIGETYNIGGDNQKTNLEVVEIICNLLEELLPNKPVGVKKYKDLIKFVKDRPGHDQRYAIDASKIKRELGWAPEETFESGIRKTVEWYLKNDRWCNRVLSGAYRLERIGVKPE